MSKVIGLLSSEREKKVSDDMIGCQTALPLQHFFFFFFNADFVTAATLVEALQTTKYITIFCCVVTLWPATHILCVDFLYSGGNVCYGCFCFAVVGRDFYARRLREHACFAGVCAPECSTEFTCIRFPVRKRVQRNPGSGSDCWIPSSLYFPSPIHIHIYFYFTIPPSPPCRPVRREI